MSGCLDCKRKSTTTDAAIAQIDGRLRKLGLVLPAPPAPAGVYHPVVIRHDIGCVSGQFPLLGGKLEIRGRVGAELSELEGRRAAEIAALNVLAQIRSASNGFTGFAGLLRLDGYVASAPGFTSQPRILDAASECFIAVLGPELGAHTRTAFSVAQLPLDAPIELGVTFATNGTCSRPHSNATHAVS